MIGARFAVRAIPGPDSYEFVAPLIFLCWVLFETGRLGAASGRLRSAAKRAAKEYPMIEAGFEIPL